MTSRMLLVSTASLAFAWAAPSIAQQAAARTAVSAQARAPAPPAAADEMDEEEEIVVTGQRPRGSVIGDIPPENTLTPADIRATGATSVTELLAAVAPQTGSARGRGGGPVLLLNGQRVSGFGEIRDLPPEAIVRVEILPEEVALKYGYAADQRVVNIVLRQRFRSTTARGEAGIATAGGYASGEADVSQLRIVNNGRMNLTLHAEGNSALREDERSIKLQPVATQPAPTDPRPLRTLVGSRRQVRGSAIVNRTVLGNVSATLNADLTHDEGRSLFGIPTGSLTVPATSPFATRGTTVLRGVDALGPLTRDTRSDSGHLGLSFNGTAQPWRYSMTATADIVRSVTLTDRDPDFGAMQARISANDPVIDPLGALTVARFPRDYARSLRKSGGVDGTLNGPLATLPAGRANVTLKAGLDTLHLDSFATRAGVSRSARLGRDHAVGSVSVDLPVARRGGALGAIGKLTLNANAEAEHLSDFGTLTTIGADANWSPVARLNFIGSWTREEGAPSINALGDPVLATPGTRVFDYITGTTVLVTATTGGNPALLADRRNVVKLGGNWQPFEKTDLRLRADFASSRLTRPVQSFPGATAALQAAFPDRFTRVAGTLSAVDFRPVNYDSARTDTVRVGFDFSKPLKSAAPPQALIDQFRRARQQAGGPPGGGRGGFGGGRGGGFGGGGGPFGGNQRGRIQLSLTDSITLVDRALIRPGLPVLDYLRGSASGSGGGTARHVVEAQTGYYNNGYGVRLSADYRSATHVTGGPSGDLDFAPLTTFDVRLFANLGEDLRLLVKHPWLRGASLRFDVDNLFDARQRVTNGLGDTPLSYQPALISPIGRTVSITFRKLFVPSRFFRRPAAQQQRPS